MENLHLLIGKSSNEMGHLYYTYVRLPDVPELFQSNMACWRKTTLVSCLPSERNLHFMAGSSQPAMFDSDVVRPEAFWKFERD